MDPPLKPNPEQDTHQSMVISYIERWYQWKKTNNDPDSAPPLKEPSFNKPLSIMQYLHKKSKPSKIEETKMRKSEETKKLIQDKIDESNKTEEN